jgi:hypothetical protein
VDQLIGIGAGAAVLVAAAGYFTLRRPGVAVLAGIAAGATWVVFVFEWIVYDVRENGPVYAKSTEYVQYREAIESSAVAIGFGSVPGSGGVRASRRRPSRSPCR